MSTGSAIARHPPLAAREDDRLALLLCALAQNDRPLRASELGLEVAQSGLTRAQLAPFLALDRRRYAHREVYRSRHLEVGCIGWRTGQGTPIHDHHDSACCVLVLAGVLTNTEYETYGAGLLARGTRTLREGELLLYAGPEIHRMVNEDRADLYTLHFYSPPLPPMRRRVRAR